MDTVLLLKIESLHARTVEEQGLQLRIGGHNLFTGPVVAHLDSNAAMPANCGMLNLNTGRIRLHWGVIATIPFAADAFVEGFTSPEDSSPMKISFEEEGSLLKDDSGFDAIGPGRISPGSLLSHVRIPIQPNFVKMIPTSKGRDKDKLSVTLARGETARCIFLPKSYLDLKLPATLGGGTQRLHLTGGFFLVPVMTLQQPKNSSK